MLEAHRAGLSKWDIGVLSSVCLAFAALIGWQAYRHSDQGTPNPVVQQANTPDIFDKIEFSPLEPYEAGPASISHGRFTPKLDHSWVGAIREDEYRADVLREMRRANDISDQAREEAAWNAMRQRHQQQAEAPSYFDQWKARQDQQQIADELRRIREQGEWYNRPYRRY